ncbi:conjugative transfer region protein TrbK [Sphingobium faniae]|nr:conjugative transfer region protein TrbK [Sphingobium faniae]
MNGPMSRNAKIAGVAALAGIMLAVAAVEALREPGDMPLDAVLPLLDEGEQQTLLARELDRCAALTMPDSGCEQAWAANRRRFFSKDIAVPEPEIGNGSDSPAIPADPAGSTVP